MARGAGDHRGHHRDRTSGHGADRRRPRRCVAAGRVDLGPAPVPAGHGRLRRGARRARGHVAGVALAAAARGARGRLATLTPRELAVFRIIVRGNPNKQVAYELGASERTIKAHRQKIMQKLQVRFFAEVVSIAERLGYLTGAEKEKRD